MNIVKMPQRQEYQPDDLLEDNKGSYNDVILIGIEYSEEGDAQLSLVATDMDTVTVNWYLDQIKMYLLQGDI